MAKLVACSLPGELRLGGCFQSEKDAGEGHEDDAD
jgi:hypothetical protein